MKRRIATALLLATCAQLVAVSSLAQAQRPTDLATASKALGWRIGLACYNFRETTFFDSVDKAAELGVTNVEGFFRQTVSDSIAKHLDYQLTADELKVIRQKLDAAGVGMPTYYVHKFPADLGDRKRVFEFARALGVETIVSEPEQEMLESLDALCDQYQINLAIHNHTQAMSPMSWDPKALVALLEGRGKRVGVCADIGFWIRCGFDPVESLDEVKDRLLVVHLRDLEARKPDAAGVPLGEGAADIEQILDKLYQLEVQPTLLTIEYTKPQKDLMAELAQSVKFVTGRVSIIAEYHRSYFVRTGGIRRSVGVTPEELTKIKGAIPGTAPATPRKPRKLLVADLNVGRGGHPSRPHANLAVKLMGERTGAYVAEFAESPDDFLWENLRDYDAVFLNNTLGDLFPTAEHRESFSRFISEGGGLLANHAASVTATNWDEYGQILGATGAAHRSTEERVIIKLDDPDNPINAPYNGESFELVDEFFRFSKYYSRDRVHVLQSIDPDRTDMNQGRAFGKCTREDNDYPVCWVRQHGKGRVFYTTVGHNPYRFWDADFLKHFLAAIQFALGDLDVDTTPSARISAAKK